MQKLLTHVGLAAAAFIAVYGLTHPTTTVVTTRAQAPASQVAVAPITAAPAAALPAPDVKAIAGQQYLAAVTAYDAALAASKARLQALPQNQLAAAVPAIQALIVAMETEETAVLEIQFPPVAQADAAAELQRIRADLVTAEAFVKGPSAVAWKTLNDTIPLASAASSALRTDLGLPPVPNV